MNEVIEIIVIEIEKSKLKKMNRKRVWFHSFGGKKFLHLPLGKFIPKNKETYCYFLYFSLPSNSFFHLSDNQIPLIIYLTYFKFLLWLLLPLKYLFSIQATPKNLIPKTMKIFGEKIDRCTLVPLSFSISFSRPCPSFTSWNLSKTHP